jgi:hypothetical protein
LKKKPTTTDPVTGELLSQTGSPGYQPFIILT